MTVLLLTSILGFSQVSWSQSSSTDFLEHFHSKSIRQLKLRPKTDQGFRLGSFIDGRAITNIYSLDHRTGRAEKDLWSGSYWPLYRGGIAFRYGMSQGSSNWRTNYDNYRYSRSDSDTYNLSPAEKYDLLIDDRNFSLTEAMWNRGQYFYDSRGRVDKWMGFCHGWAAASLMEARPRRSVTVRTARGRRITFRPADIKALASAMWARTDFEMFYAGKRCNQHSPHTDRDGRLTDPECFDINPGVFHIALVNLVGLRGQSFVFDANYDYEVWNHPIESYRIRYFNPQTRAVQKRIEDAVIPLRRYYNDKFSMYRSTRTRSIVGVHLELKYKDFHRPSRSSRNSSSSDLTKKAYYYYDLELDRNGDVIGGEWYQNAHPDLIWRPRERGRSQQKLSWNDPDSRPRGVEEARRAGRAGYPHSEIVRRLIEWSR